MIEEGTLLKVLSSCSNHGLSHTPIVQEILLIGNNEERMNLLIDNYKLDERYRNNNFKIVSSIGAKMLNIEFDRGYTHIILFAEPHNPQSDTVNFYYWRYFREKFSEAKIIVELLSAKNREELEEKYEDRNNEFVSIFQVGLMVQELQDDGMIHLVENLTKEKILEIGKIEKTLF
jgi:hypothetical protein